MPGKFVINESHPSALTPILALELLKSALRLPDDLTDEDDFLTMLISSAEATIENMTRLVLRPQQWIGYFTSFGKIQIKGKQYAQIIVPRLPLRSVTSITYYDSNLDQTTVDPDTISIYKLGTIHSEIYIKDPTFLCDLGEVPTPSKSIYLSALIQTIRL